MTAACPSRRFIPLVFAIGSFALLIQGCGDGSAGGNVTLAPASGTVTFGGSPLSGARVSAYPEKGPVAMAVTDDSGNFTLSTGAKKGAAVGRIDVSVTVPTATEDSGAPKIDPNDPLAMTRAMQTYQEQNPPSGARGGGASAKPEQKSVIPAKYADPKTSGLSFEIKQDQDNVLKIELQ